MEAEEQEKVDEAGKEPIDPVAHIFTCPVCQEIPRQPPLFNCPRGHLVCNKCQPKVSVIDIYQFRYYDLEFNIYYRFFTVLFVAGSARDFVMSLPRGYFWRPWKEER